MKWVTGVCDGGLFTESYCNICNAQLISESQRVAHYESKKHANKVRLFYMLHPEDGGPASKRLRPDNADSEERAVDGNKCCSLCNMFFTSAIVAQSHYQGKTHAKSVKLVLGSSPTISTTSGNTHSHVFQYTHTLSLINTFHEYALLISCFLCHRLLPLSIRHAPSANAASPSPSHYLASDQWQHSV
uniref:Zinc finger matrin-type protein 4-like n=1 Tax=Salmo trutta TaxID=8032 RepID=A0A673WLI9_SALTR